MTKRSFIIQAALSVLLAGHAAAATTAKPPSFHVEITGHGKPMILIPSLASSGKTWDGTVAHYKDQYECHVLTLACFAGEPRIEAPFLETVRKDLAAYIRENKMNKPVIVGHSLGGVMAQAEQMRKMYSGPPTEQTEKMGEMAVKSMVTSPADFETIMG
jgi:N-formylmaleamate deformylase